MLRLVKICNSVCSVPEPIPFARESFTVTPLQGAALTEVGGKITAAVDYPELIVMGKDIGGPTVVCFEVTGDMIFLADYAGEGEPILGERVALKCVGELPTAVCPDKIGCGKIIGLSEHEKLVYVKFDRKKEYEK